MVGVCLFSHLRPLELMVVCFLSPFYCISSFRDMVSRDLCLFHEGFVKFSFSLVLVRHKYSCQCVRPSEPLTMHSWFYELIVE